MTIDKLLNRIVPLDLGLEDKSDLMRRGIKLFLAVLIVFVIVYTAARAALDNCPAGVSGWHICIMIGWYIFFHSVIYYVIIAVLAASCGDLNNTMEEIVVANCIPRLKDDPASANTPVQPRIHREFSKNVVFSPCINEPAVIEYIKSNQDKFATSEDIALLFFIMQKNGYIGSTMKKYHDLISSLVPCRSYDQLSHSLQRIKEIYDYYKEEEKRVKLVRKCKIVEDVVQGFLHDQEVMKRVMIVKKVKKLRKKDLTARDS